jgi:hypothetical protein
VTLDTDRETENLTAVEWDGRDLLAEIDALTEQLARVRTIVLESTVDAKYKLIALQDLLRQAP